MKTYKYWIYYLKETDYLYAYTDNKKYAKEFEKFRDMDKFIKLTREISSDIVNELAKEHQEKYLKKSKIDIYDKKTMKWFKSHLILTMEEELTINNTAIQILYDTLYRYCWDNPYVFNKKIIKALDTLEYTKIYNQINQDSENSDIDQEIKIKPDQLGIFIHCYGKTIRR